MLFQVHFIDRGINCKGVFECNSKQRNICSLPSVITQFRAILTTNNNQNVSCLRRWGGSKRQRKALFAVCDELTRKSLLTSVQTTVRSKALERITYRKNNFFHTTDISSQYGAALRLWLKS